MTYCHFVLYRLQVELQSLRCIAVGTKRLTSQPAVWRLYKVCIHLPFLQTVYVLLFSKPAAQDEHDGFKKIKQASIEE